MSGFYFVLSLGLGNMKVEFLLLCFLAPRTFEEVKIERLTLALVPGCASLREL